jgi:hypothetical protein
MAKRMGLDYTLNPHGRPEPRTGNREDGGRHLFSFWCQLSALSPFQLLPVTLGAEGFGRYLLVKNITPNYELSINLGDAKQRLAVGAQLSSPLLDPILHPNGIAKVIFGVSGAARKGVCSCILESFQLDSVTEYLRTQGLVRYTLETELVRSRSALIPAEAGIGPTDIWKDAKIDSVLFDPRIVQTVQVLAPLGLRMKGGILQGLTGEEVDRIVSMSDKPDTWSTFTVTVEAEWRDGGRYYLATFRDGGLAEFERA